MDASKIRTTLIGSADERAVSPVIGVILMVAITVILAAVIAAFVMDIGPGGESVNANVAISGDGTSTVDISINDGQDADNLILVDPDTGQVAADTESEEANTGATHTVNNSAPSDFDTSGSGVTDGDYDVYAINGDLTAGDPLDAADGHLKVGDFTLTT